MFLRVCDTCLDPRPFYHDSTVLWQMCLRMLSCLDLVLVAEKKVHDEAAVLEATVSDTAVSDTTVSDATVSDTAVSDTTVALVLASGSTFLP